VNPEIETKTERVVELLEREGLGGVVLNTQYNFAWITCGASNGIDLSRENGAASVFVRRDGKRFLLANNIEMTRLLAEEVSADDFEPVEFKWQEEKASGNFLIEKAKSLSTGEVAADINIGSMTRAIDGLLARTRYQLTPGEVERYKVLGRDAGQCLRVTLEKITLGETEIEIAAKMRSELAFFNIHSVVTLVAADERIVKFRHPVPTSNPWKKTVLLVTCAKRGGLIASLSRIACLGDISSELEAKAEAAAFVNACLWSATRAGTTGAELYRVAAEAYASRGFAGEIDKHHQGGSAGYRTRDWVAHPQSTEVVAENQAFAWNPSITGTKVEETVILTAEGVKTITSSPDFPTITHVVDGIEYRSPGILHID
jgi:Xaa-Pro aminopeptidase